MKQLWLIWLVIGVFCLVPVVSFGQGNDSTSVTFKITNPETREIDTMLGVDTIIITPADRDAGYKEIVPSTNSVVSANASYKIQAKLSATTSNFGVQIKRGNSSYTTNLGVIYVGVPYSGDELKADSLSIPTTIKITDIGWDKTLDFSSEEVTINIKLVSSF